MTDKIFLNYDAAQLDQQYDIEERDDWTYHEAEYTRLSAEAVAQFETATLDIPYGDSPNERLDVYPANTANAPVLIFIHGGYWREGDMAMWRFIARGIVGNDVTLVLPTYDVNAETNVGTKVEQMHKALEWTYNNIAKFGGDPQNITVSSHSAGGHLAAMLITADWPARGYRDDVIKAAICLSGSFDMKPLSLCRYLRDDYSLSFTADEVKHLSPTLREPRVTCPLTLTVGAGVTAEYLRNTDLLASVWKDKGFAVTCEHYPDHHHFSIILELADPQSQLSKTVCQIAKH